MYWILTTVFFMVYTIINPYFTGERNRPTLKHLSQGSQLESFKAAIWTQAIWLQNPCSLQHRLPHTELPAAGRLSLNRHPPSHRGNIWHVAREVDEHRHHTFPPRFVKSEFTYCVLDHMYYNAEREFTQRWNYYDLSHLDPHSGTTETQVPDCINNQRNAN